MRCKKNRVLFLTRTLGRAGVGVSLMPVLQSLDFEKLDVTLGVQFPEKELEAQVPRQVKIVYYGEITSWIYQKIFDFNQKLGQKRENPILRFMWHCFNKLEDLRMAYKVCKCFGGRWDTATAYHQGMASWYVMKLVNAKKKNLWYHAARVEQPWYEKLFAKADTIITDSENARQVLLAAWGDGFANKITAMHCILPTEELHQKAVAPITLAGRAGQTVIFSCGRLDEEKGMDLTVEAAAIVRDTLPDKDFVWILVGDGSARERIRARIEALGLEDRVLMAGYQSNPYPWFAACDLYVQPSRMECFGITIAEALYFGKPVISTCSAGGMEQIRHGINGLLCQISGESIAEAVIQYFTDLEVADAIHTHLQQMDYEQTRKSAACFINKIHGA